MVMPGDNVELRGELIHPIAMEEGLRFRYPRRWPHRWFRSCHQDHQITSIVKACTGKPASAGFPVRIDHV